MPPPLTILKDVRKLAPATILTIEPDGRQSEQTSMSEPMMSHDAVGFYLLSREVSRHVKAS
jgi:hypothetical protein